MINWDAPEAEKMLEACSHEKVLMLLKSKERQAFLNALEEHGYELRVVLKGQCY